MRVKRTDKEEFKALLGFLANRNGVPIEAHDKLTEGDYFTYLVKLAKEVQAKEVQTNAQPQS